jgi:hypothetical protein
VKGKNKIKKFKYIRLPYDSEYDILIKGELVPKINGEVYPHIKNIKKRLA